jgi:murein DD-endopeptidase MepM/ murein hydrolase activator NlpD
MGVVRSSVPAIGALAAAVAVLALSSSAGAASPTTRARGTAEAFAVSVIVPGSPVAGTPSVAAPPDTVSLEGGFAYPADGTTVSAGSATASAATTLTTTGQSQASSAVSSLSLFGGEVTATQITSRARAAASSSGATSDVTGTAVSGLTVLGQPAAASGRVTLADWGYADVGAGSASKSATSKTRAARSSAVALAVHLTAAHGGLPAGTQIVVGSAAATAEADKAVAPSKPRTAPPANPKSKPKAAPTPPEPKQSPFGAPPLRTSPKRVTPRLTAGGYVFPVYGPSSWSDTYGAPRADTGWHHGVDVFAPLGAPVLAVAEGKVFSVGWNDVGGNRVWLQDDQGNQFYYAHLSAFSPLAANGHRVPAGAVLGFVGNTGDAQGTPYHLHFEIHPVSLLHLGYDGAVNPTPYLTAWQHLRDLGFPGLLAAKGWATGGGLDGSAPQPGAILLQASDISQASGLDPRSLTHAMRDLARAEGDGGLVRSGAPAGTPGPAER